MSSVVKPLFAALALLGACASIHAEQADTTYSDDGRYLESGAGSNRRAVAMLEAPDGRVLQVSAVNGGCGGSTVCPRMTWLTTTGTYIASYGPALSSAGGFEAIAAAAIDHHGRVVVVGTSPPTVGGRNVRVMRFLPNGDLDAAFAGDGGTDVDFFGVDDYGTAVAIDPDDNVVVTGQAGRTATDTDFGVARLRGTDGLPDTSFSGDGQAGAFFDLGPTLDIDVPKALAISPNGDRIVVVGVAFDSVVSRYRVAMARFNRDGTADTSFCHVSCSAQGAYTSIHDGKRVYYFGNDTAHSDIASGVALAGNGDLYVVGETYATDGSNKRAAIARLDVDADYVNETLNDGLGSNAAWRSVRLSDASPQRVLVLGDSGPSANYLLLQAFSSALAPVAGYGNCLDTSGFCFIGGTGLGDNGPDEAESLSLDRRGRPLVAGTFVVSSGDDDGAIFLRFTNDNGPRPDLIFQDGFQ